MESMRTMVSRLAGVLLVTSLMLLGGCSTGNTDGDQNPVDDAELIVEGDGTDVTIPNILPEAVELDIDELPEDADDEVLAKQALEGTRSVYARVARASGSIVHRFHELADEALALGARVREDLTSLDQTTVQGDFVVNQMEVAYKADFAAFDIDGDGDLDGSGNAAELPVAVRIWTDSGDGYERFLCALISTRPSTENIGAGELYVLPAAALVDAPADAQLYVVYDRTNPNHRWNEAYVIGSLHPLHLLEVGAARVDVRRVTEDDLTTGDPEAAAGVYAATSDASWELADVEKTVRSACQFSESLYGFSTFQSAAHWQRGGGAILMSGLATGGIRAVDFTDVCVSLDLEDTTSGSACADFDVQDMNFLEVPTEDLVGFPADFPATPTF
jgi:hypothetical protein